MKNQANEPIDDRGVGDRRVVRPPGVRVEVVAEAGHDDVEALEPHADQHEDRHHVERHHVGAGPAQNSTSGTRQLQKYMPQYAHAYCLVALANTLARSKWSPLYHAVNTSQT